MFVIARKALLKARATNRRSNKPKASMITAAASTRSQVQPVKASIAQIPSNHTQHNNELIAINSPACVWAATMSPTSLLSGKR